MYSTRAFGRPTASSPRPTTREHVFPRELHTYGNEIAPLFDAGSQATSVDCLEKAAESDALPVQASKPATDGLVLIVQKVD